MILSNKPLSKALIRLGMLRLFSSFVFRKLLKTDFLSPRPIFELSKMALFNNMFQVVVG